MSLSDVGETFPAVKVPETAPDRTAPTVSASPAGGSYPVAQQVTLTADEFGADIYYTLDGTDPIIGDQLSTPEPLHYTGPITIDSPELTTLKFAAFDPSNNPSTIGTERLLHHQRSRCRPRRPSIDSTVGRSRNRDVELGALLTPA